MRIGGLFVMAVIAALVPASSRAAAREPIVLTPISSWALDYAPERCRLVRQFGSKEDPFTLEIDSFGSYTAVRFVVIGKAIPQYGRPAGAVEYSFDSDTEERPRTSMLLGTSGSLPAGTFGGAFETYEPISKQGLSFSKQHERAGKPRLTASEFGAGVHSIKLRFYGNPVPVLLKTESMAQPLKALRACVDDLYRSWGLDVARQKQITRIPVPKIATIWKLQGSFSSTMFFSGLSAYVPVRIMVDEQGAATKCVVQIENVDEEFRAAVCRSFSPRFEPAQDDKGVPIASVYQTSITYMNGR